MKKFLILTVAIFCTSQAFALDLNAVKQKAINTLSTGVGAIENVANSKQVEHEKEVALDYRIAAHYAAINDDYEVYQSGGESVYDELNKIIKDNKARNNYNYQYGLKAKALYEKITQTEVGEQLTPEEFNKQKIIIIDSAYNSLDENLIHIITLLNVY